MKNGRQIQRLFCAVAVLFLGMCLGSVAFAQSQSERCSAGEVRYAQGTIKDVLWKDVAAFSDENGYNSPTLTYRSVTDPDTDVSTFTLSTPDGIDDLIEYYEEAYLSMPGLARAPDKTPWIEYIPLIMKQDIKLYMSGLEDQSPEPKAYTVEIKFNQSDLLLQCVMIERCENDAWKKKGEAPVYASNKRNNFQQTILPIDRMTPYLKSQFAGVFLHAFGGVENTFENLGKFRANPCAGNVATENQTLPVKTVSFQIGALDISYKRLIAQQGYLNDALQKAGEDIERLYAVLDRDLANSKKSLDRITAAQNTLKSLQTKRQNAAASLAMTGRDLQTPAYKKLRRQASQIEGQIGRYFTQIEEARAALDTLEAEAPGGQKQQNLRKLLGGLVLSIERNEKKLLALKGKIKILDVSLGIRDARAKQEKENTALEDHYWQERRKILKLRAQYNAIKLREDQTSADIVNAEQKENLLAAEFININNNGSPLISKIYGDGFLAVSAVDPTPFIQQIDRDLPVFTGHLLQLGQSRKLAREKVLKASEAAQEASRRLAVAGYKSMGAQAFIEFVDYADDIYDGFRMGGYAFAASRGLQRLVESVVLGPPSYYDYQSGHAPSLGKKMDSAAERLGKSGTTVFMDVALADFLAQRDLTTLIALRRSYTTPQALMDARRKLSLRSSAQANRAMQNLGKKFKKRVLKDLVKNVTTTYAKMKAAELIEGPAFEAVVRADAKLALAVRDLRRTSNMYFETRKLYENLRKARKTLVSDYRFSSKMRIKNNQINVLSTKSPGYKLLIEDGRDKAIKADLQVMIGGVKAAQPDPEKLEFVLSGKALSDMKIKAGKAAVFIDVRQ